MTSSVAVVKIGGSLLVQPKFVARLRAWLDHYLSEGEIDRVVLIVGGGSLVEGLRAIDRVNPMQTSVSHWLAVQLMDVNGGILRHWWPQLPVCQSIDQLRTSDGVITLMEVEPFLRQEEPQFPGTPLPEGWHVTSDSIAARLAEVLAARELVLLKRVSRNDGRWDEASQEGFVDAYFPRATQGVASVHALCLP